MITIAGNVISLSYLTMTIFKHIIKYLLKLAQKQCTLNFIENINIA